MRPVCSSLFVVLVTAQVVAQPSAPEADTLRKDALNVYMEASDYIRKEIPYINYVRDLQDAGVYIISTSQGTGAGGTEYTYFLVGQHEFAGMRDTVTVVTYPDETTELRRSRQVNALKMGLMRYVARTPLSDYIRITFSEPLAETVTSDKWKSWVFRASLSGSLNEQKTYESTYVRGSFSASKTTREWKINLSTSYYFSRSKYDLGTRTVTSDNSSKSVSGLIVRSLSDHWSYGGSASAGASSYSNENLIFSLMPAIEYDLFPYSESTRRQFRILYKAGFNHVDYIDTTIYDKKEENLWLHNLTAAFEVVQKWGSVDVSFGYSNYFHDWSKNNLSFDGYLSLRVAKGLSINMGGGVSVIHDQLGLVKGGATPEQVLLRIREQETQYQYYTSFGFSYTFGSIYNNVVNPRFGSTTGSSGTMVIVY